jgi:hypothetical protein
MIRMGRCGSRISLGYENVGCPGAKSHLSERRDAICKGENHLMFWLP